MAYGQARTLMARKGGRTPEQLYVALLGSYLSCLLDEWNARYGKGAHDNGFLQVSVPPFGSRNPSCRSFRLTSPDWLLHSFQTSFHHRKAQDRTTTNPRLQVTNSKSHTQGRKKESSPAPESRETMAQTPTFTGEKSLQEPNIHVSLTHEPLDAMKSISRVKSPKAGAVVLFAGP